MQKRYDSMVAEMKAAYGIRIHRWRSSMTGCAWELRYHDGSVRQLIEAPYPRGPMSAIIFFHEVGHHALGLGRYTPRCLEEYRVWMWALDAMRRYDFCITERVKERVNDSIRYAVDKAVRRGLKNIPAELKPYYRPRRRPLRARRP